MENTEQKIFRLVAEEFAMDPDQITDDLGPDDISAWSSIRHFRLLRNIEEEFDIQFFPDEIMIMDTIKKIIELVIKRSENGNG